MPFNQFPRIFSGRFYCVSYITRNINMEEEYTAPDSSLMKKNSTITCMPHDSDSESRDSTRHNMEGKNRSCDTIKHSFRRLFLALKICGLMIDKNERSRWKYIFQVTLFSLLLGVNWANVIRYFAAYEIGEPFSPELCIKILIHTIYVLVALTNTAFLPCSLSMPSLLTRWQLYHEKHNIPSSPVTKQIRKHCLVSIIVWLMGFMITLLLITLEQYSESPIGLYQHKPFANDYKRLIDVPTVNKVVVAAIYLQMENGFCMYFSCFIIVALALRKEFEVLATCCKWTSEEIEISRQRHFELSSIVTDMDRIVSPFILSIFVCCIPAICFNIYIMVVWNLPVQYKVFLILNLLLFGLALFTIIIIAARINMQVNLPSHTW